jgi:hypothetical protein
MSEGDLLLLMFLICSAVFVWGMAIKAVARKVRSRTAAADPEDQYWPEVPEHMYWQDVQREARL